ncbi:unnamed protein product [Owenia fusiformis]|uniref:Uncharacterized protein n=1 Tax=Owenia fusiformis TaxID=6347 RepID=A0A8J1Y8B1_OWEFU|nr:unnamed protein product [Owenia fusiformis]
MAGRKQSVDFHDNKQSCSLLRGLFEQRKDGSFCDVVLKVCDQKIYAHANILTAASSYFQEILSQEGPRQFSQKSPQIIEILINDGSNQSQQDEPIYVRAVETLIDFIYTSKISLDDTIIGKVVDMAKVMRMEAVVKICGKYLEKLQKSVEKDGGELEDDLSWPVDIDSIKTPDPKAGEQDTMELDKSTTDEGNVELRSSRGRPIKRKVFTESVSLKSPPKKAVDVDDDPNYSPPRKQNRLALIADAATAVEAETAKTDGTTEPKEPIAEEAIHKCDHCTYKTSNKYHFKRHLTVHNIGTMHRCDECRFATRKPREIVEHKNAHKRDRNECDYCDLLFNSKEDFDLHYKNHKDTNKPFYCWECKARFKTRYQLELHHPTHSDNRPFACDKCDATFKWKHALKNHQVVHSGTKGHLCTVCGYATAHKQQLKAHMLIHSGDLFKCEVEGCEFKCTKKQNLKYHKLTHTKEKPHQCEQCGQSFTLLKNMKRHKLMHSKILRCKCPQCDFGTTRMDKLRDHLQKQHQVGGPAGTTVQIPYTTELMVDDRLERIIVQIEQEADKLSDLPQEAIQDMVHQIAVQSIQSPGVDILQTVDGTRIIPVSLVTSQVGNKSNNQLEAITLFTGDRQIMTGTIGPGVPESAVDVIEKKESDLQIINITTNENVEHNIDGTEASGVIDERGEIDVNVNSEEDDVEQLLKNENMTGIQQLEVTGDNHLILHPVIQDGYPPQMTSQVPIDEHLVVKMYAGQQGIMSVQSNVDDVEQKIILQSPDENVEHVEVEKVDTMGLTQLKAEDHENQDQDNVIEFVYRDELGVAMETDPESLQRMQSDTQSVVHITSLLQATGQTSQGSVSTDIAS